MPLGEDSVCREASLQGNSKGTYDSCLPGRRELAMDSGFLRFCRRNEAYAGQSSPQPSLCLAVSSETFTAARAAHMPPQNQRAKVCQDGFRSGHSPLPIACALFP